MRIAIRFLLFLVSEAGLLGSVSGSVLFCPKGSGSVKIDGSGSVPRIRNILTEITKFFQFCS